MKLDFNDLLYSLSYALDCVEHDLLGVSTHHGQRVAAMCVKMGQGLGIDKGRLSDLAACAILHDNALTEYIQSEYSKDVDVFKPNYPINMGVHCSMGEKNISMLPFATDVKGSILYHHENANGSGPFRKKADETPKMAQLIHLADQIDARWNLGKIDSKKYQEVVDYVKRNQDIMFSPYCVNAFMNSITPGFFYHLQNEVTLDLLHQMLPSEMRDYDDAQIKGICNFFAKIIDYKSSFTCSHSLGIAQKAEKMGEYYHYSKEDLTKIYMAGAFHDAGKLVIDRDILEKPGKLDGNEYAQMQNHAYYTYELLRKVKGIEDITMWACLHHEKLNGEGYPFGKTGDELNQQERLMGCIDIYQALTEKRSYKEGFSHEKTMSIMKDMADKGFIDSSIVKDIDKVFGPVQAA